MNGKGIFRFLFAATDPQEILAEVYPQGTLLDQPPPASGYRDADIQGISCDSCVRFGLTSMGEQGISTGVCGLWESWVEGDNVCDYYSEDTPPMDDKGEYDWNFADATLAEIHMSGTEQATEENGLVRKAIMRTGEWPVIPSSQGVLKRPLQIVREGKSDPEKGIIALSELVENFGKVIQRVQVPLSDDSEDHKNITRVNTGFVEKIWVEPGENGTDLLMADIDFTEPEIREKALRGTYADISCGVPFGVVKDGTKYGAVLEHCAITNRPFMSDLGPFFMAASDVISEQLKDKQVNHFTLAWKPAEAEEEKEEKKISSGTITAEKIAENAITAKDITEGVIKSPEQDPTVYSFQDQINGISQAMFKMSLNPNQYEVVDIKGNSAIIHHSISGTAWTAPFEFSEGKAIVAEVGNWEIQKEEEKPAAKKISRGPSPAVGALEEAQRLREIRLSQPSNPANQGGIMATASGTLAGVELSDLPEDARAHYQAVLDENAKLRTENRQKEADKRIEELKKLGFEERPGALRFYRDIFLSDDGGPAAVLLSEGTQEKERFTALQILDRFIDGIKGSDGMVVLSDQALVSGNDNKPPATPEGEQKPLEERVADAREAIGMKAKK